MTVVLLSFLIFFLPFIFASFGIPTKATDCHPSQACRFQNSYRYFLHTWKKKRKRINYGAHRRVYTHKSLHIRAHKHLHPGAYTHKRLHPSPTGAVTNSARAHIRSSIQRRCTQPKSAPSKVQSKPRLDLLMHQILVSILFI